MKINGGSLTGKIKELHSQFGLEFFYTEDKEQAIRYIKQINDNCKNSISVDIETSGLTFYKDKLLGIGIGFSTKKAIYFNFRYMVKEDIKSVLETISTLKSKKIMHNSFFDRKFMLGSCNVNVPCDFDTYTYAHTLHTDKQYYKESLGLKALTKEFTPFGEYENELVEYKKEYCKKNKIKLSDFSYDLIPDEILSVYCCMDCISTLVLYNVFEKKVREYEKTDWTKIREVIDIKHQANDLYIQASLRGVKVNREKILEIHQELSQNRDTLIEKILSNEDIKKAEKIIKVEALKKMQEKRKTIAPLSRCRKEWKETKFNIFSNQHKAILFFKVMGLEPIESTDSGADSTDVHTIEYYANKGIEIMQDIDDLNKINKILSSFLNVEGGEENGKGLWGFTSDEHPYLHPNYNINGTISSRLSTTDTNLAQYPSRGLGKIVKKCIEVEEGYKLISFDFKSFELSILGFIANEPKFKEMFDNGYDPHSFTAYNVFSEKMELESKDIKDIMKEIANKYKDTFRYKAKSINFAIPYDTTAFGLSKSTNSTKKEAQDMLDKYRESNSAIALFMDNNKKEAHKQGYVENYFGARMFYRKTKRYNPFANNLKKDYDALAEFRTTTNWKIQSFNSFYLYKNMVPMFKEIKERNLDISLMFTIYDSMMLRVKEDIEDSEVVGILKRYLESDNNGFKFGIDVHRTPKHNRSWYAYEEISLYSTKMEK